MTESENNEVFTSVRQAGRYARTTGQALFVAIKKGELKAKKMMVLNKRNRWMEQWCIRKGDIDEYRKSKYNRDKRTFEGEKLFDIERNRWSVLHASKALSTMLGIPYPAHRLYYQIRMGYIKASKKGSAWVIAKEEFVRIYHDELARIEQGMAK
jgi:hypothetical protein